MQLFRSHGHVFGGALLIAGTTIGVGMLALPIATGPAGFFPSIAVYFACWLFMLCTGLLMLEVCTWMPEDANLITMAGRLLGVPGKVACWFLYLLLFELVMMSHIAGGASILYDMLGRNLSVTASMILYTILFSPVVYLGTKIVDRINLFMFSGVLLSYFGFVFVSIRYVDVAKLATMNWGKIWFAIPVLFTAFTYQVIIPTLVTYMKRDFKKVRTAIFFGTSIPLIVYLIWQLLILGIIPVLGPFGLIESSHLGFNAVTPLRHFVASPSLVKIGNAFAFFTMTASYIALALAFLDFLADGLKVKKEGWNKMLLCFAVFLPPFFIAYFNPTIFLHALGFAGGISCAILFGVYPPLMVWSGRYRKKYEIPSWHLRGGKVFLSFLVLLIILEVALEIIPHIL